MATVGKNMTADIYPILAHNSLNDEMLLLGQFDLSDPLTMEIIV